MNNTINAGMLKEAFLTGAKSIEAKKELINELNVFPVPDGDTGTNMTLTIMSAAKEVAALNNPSMADLCKAISSGSLRGARGNSGVILSQLLRGFTKIAKENEELTVDILAVAFDKAVETAYKAVMKPKEGTILTVARGGAERAKELAEEGVDLETFCDETVKKMQEVLDYTPELLPVLKEAGVVDSGGKGLLTVVEGVVNALKGEIIPFDAPVVTASISEKRGAASDDISTADIKFGYCTEFIILLDKEISESEELKLKAFLESIGDSIVLVADDGVCKIHVHTNDPGAALSKAVKYGQLSRIKIDNMREEHRELLFKESDGSEEKADDACREDVAVSETSSESATLDSDETSEYAESFENEITSNDEPSAPKKKDAFIAVSVGEGLTEIFKGLGVDVVIAGGQTMNPSTDDFVTAAEKLNAENIYILPNNKNIILAAEQAKYLVEEKNIIVIPTKSVPQGITAMINYLYDNSPEDNTECMTEALKTVKTGQVTYAVRDTSIDGFDIRQNDIMGLDDKTIKAVGTDINDVSFELSGQMIDENSAFVTVYYGEDISEETAEEFVNRLKEQYPDIEIELHSGNQPIYYYIISVE